VRAFEAARQDDSEASLLCAACGEESPANFELCWKCRKPLAQFH
jgi:predicted amidophosphoribosyltransferase